MKNDILLNDIPKIVTLLKLKCHNAQVNHKTAKITINIYYSMMKVAIFQFVLFYFYFSSFIRWWVVTGSGGGFFTEREYATLLIPSAEMVPRRHPWIIC